MKIKRKNKKYIYGRLSFWLGILIVGAALGIIAQFTRAWVEPPSAATPPGGDIAAPINTGATTQTKHGGDICVDTNSDSVNEACLSTGSGGVPQGTIAIWSGSLSAIPSGWALCNGNFGTPDLRSNFVFGAPAGQDPGGWGRIGFWDGSGSPYVQNYRYIDDPGGYYQVAFIMKMADGFSNTILAGSSHLESECASAGGEVVLDGTAKFCRFDGEDSCPSSWTQYNNWSTTAANTCNGTFDTSHSCNPVAGDTTTCTTASHGWGNVAPSSESCTVDNNTWLSGTYTTSGWTCIYNSFENVWCACNVLHSEDTWNMDCSVCSSLAGTSTCVDGWAGANELYAVQHLASSCWNSYCPYTSSYAYCSPASSSCFSTINQIGCY